jgi:hypothetical protein
MDQKGSLLIVLLRISAVIMWFAVIAVFMPASWIEFTHRWLGIGDLPEGPITYYLARSLSAFYVITGGLLWLLSLNIERYYTIGLYLCYSCLVFGPVVFFIDMSSGMPFYWTCFEGPFVVLFSSLLLILLKRSQV